MDSNGAPAHLSLKTLSEVHAGLSADSGKNLERALEAMKHICIPE
jgi:hypothetical protein